MIKVMIVDDQNLMREGLKTILELEEDLEVVATAPNGREAYELIETVKPNIILMDIRMPILNGVEATKLIKREYRDIGILILTTFDTDDLIIEALAAGADGYVLKDIDGDKLIQSIRDSHNGDMILPAKIAAKLATRILKIDDNSNGNKMNLKDFEITEREKEICELLCEGYTNKQICETLYLTTGTVKNYLTKIYSKLGVSNRTTAILFLKKIK